MGKYDYLKKYIFDFNDESRHESRHCFQKIKEKDVLDSEERIGREIPKELKEFYEEIGCGFLKSIDNEMNNRIMGPETLADFYLGEGIFENERERDFYDMEKELVFFEKTSTTFICMKIAEETDDGKAPIYDFDTKIADSLEEFIKRMDEEPDYYRR